MGVMRQIIPLDPGDADDAVGSEDLPSLFQLVNSGVVWSAGEAVGVAAVIAPPTTLAQISLYNNEPETTGKSYIVLRVFGIITATPAGLSQVGLSHCIQRRKPDPAPTVRDIPLSSITNMKGLIPDYDGVAIIQLAATVADDLWKPVGFSNLNAVTGVGWQLDIWNEPMVIIPPGGRYNLAAVASTTTVSTRLGFTWLERKLG